jgi:uncharacterized protein (UPF0335 family)
MTTLPQSSQKQLQQFIEQIERLEEEKKAIGDDIKEKFLEAKGLGFDVKIMRKVLRMRKMSKTEREEEEGVLSTYLHALGMISEQLGELGQAAFEREIDPSKVSKGKPKIEGDGYLDKLRGAYEAAIKRNATIMMTPDGMNAFPVSVVKATLQEYGAI